jgi:SMP-30/Gluconolactonase/LRE-like region
MRGLVYRRAFGPSVSMSTTSAQPTSTLPREHRRRPDRRHRLREQPRDRGNRQRHRRRRAAAVPRRGRRGTHVRYRPACRRARPAADPDRPRGAIADRQREDRKVRGQTHRERRARSQPNDLVVTPSGDAYITETGTPAISRATASQLARRNGHLTRWLAPKPSVVPNDPSHLNLNGIALTSDERYLLVGQTATGNLYRVDIKTRAIRRVAITGGSLAGSDGLLLRKRVLYVVTHSGGIKKVTLNGKYTAGRVTAMLTDPTLDFPTSIAASGRRLIVTNALKPQGAADFSLTSLPG